MEPRIDLGCQVRIIFIRHQKICCIHDILELGAHFVFLKSSRMLKDLLQKLIQNRFYPYRFISFEMMHIRTRIGIMFSKELESIGIRWHQLFQHQIPRLLTVECFHVPAIISNTENGYFRCLGMLHRVRDKARHLVGNMQAVSVNRTKQQMIHNIIVHRIIPPDKSFPFDPFIDPVHIFLLDIADHRITRPHNRDVRI